MKDFEANLKQLEKVIGDLSSGDKKLNNSLELYKKGLTLLKDLYAQLQFTEKEVQLLLVKNGKVKTEKFSGE